MYSDTGRDFGRFSAPAWAGCQTSDEDPSARTITFLDAVWGLLQFLVATVQSQFHTVSDKLMDLDAANLRHGRAHQDSLRMHQELSARLAAWENRIITMEMGLARTSPGTFGNGGLFAVPASSVSASLTTSRAAAPPAQSLFPPAVVSSAASLFGPPPAPLFGAPPAPPIDPPAATSATDGAAGAADHAQDI